MVSETEVTVRGRLGHNPELQQAPGKKAWVRLRVATNRRVRTAEGWADGPTSWYDVKVWDDFATNVAMSLRKGDAVIVQGALQIEEYTHGSGVTLRTPVITAHALGPDLRHVVAHVLRVNRGAPESGNGDGADDAGAAPTRAPVRRRGCGRRWTSAACRSSTTRPTPTVAGARPTAPTRANRWPRRR